MKPIKCPYCKKRYSNTRIGIKNLNFHIQEKHPEAYKYRIKTGYECLVEELNIDIKNNYFKYK